MFGRNSDKIKSAYLRVLEYFATLIDSSINNNTRQALQNAHIIRSDLGKNLALSPSFL
jgi:hypothetical protein